MQKCASPCRIPHAVPVNFPGGFYTSGCQVCTCSGFLHGYQQERMCKGLWAREVAWEQPWTLAVTALAFQSMHMCTWSPGESPFPQHPLAGRVEGEAVTLPSDTAFVILVF